MSKFLNVLRVSAMSVPEAWWYAYLALCFAQMVGWTAMVAWHEAVYGGHAHVVEYLRAVGRDSSHMIQMFILNTIGIVELGRLTMVLAQGIADRLKRSKEKFRAELIAQGIAQGEAQGEARGRAEGEAAGRAALAAEIADWNRRRLEADERGERFDEPPPME